MSILLARDVLPSHSIVMTSELVITFLVEIITLGIEEVATWKYVEVILVILSWSVFDLLPSILLDSWILF